MGPENFLWKFELDQIIFLDFTGIWSLNYKEIRMSDAKLFWGSKYQIGNFLCSQNAADPRTR